MLQQLKFYAENWKNLFDAKKVFLTLLYHLYFFKYTGKRYKGIHLGSGSIKIDGFLNFDANIFFNSDITANIEKIKLAEDSVDCIYNSHILEHIRRNETLKILKEWNRVLKPGGTIYICVPDLKALFEIYLNNLSDYDKDEEKKNKVDLIARIIYGGQTHKYNYHFTGFSFPTLKKALELSGFNNIEKVNGNVFKLKDGSTAAFKDVPISLNIKAIK